MKVRIKQSPSGCISFDGGPPQLWPKAGSVVDLPQVVAEDLIADGRAEKVLLARKTEEVGEPPVEARPAPTADEEHRTRRSATKDTPTGG
jgi:hypothetical protein